MFLTSRTSLSARGAKLAFLPERSYLTTLPISTMLSLSQKGPKERKEAKIDQSRDILR